MKKAAGTVITKGLSLIDEIFKNKNRKNFIGAIITGLGLTVTGTGITVLMAKPNESEMQSDEKSEKSNGKT